MADKKQPKKKIIKTRKPNIKNVKLDYLEPNQIRQMLWDAGWRNDTLSPVSTEPYWAITKGVIPADAQPISAFFATSCAGTMVQKMYTFICTTKYVYCIIEISGIVTYKILKYDDFAEINLYQDQYLSWQIYVDIYLTKFRFFKLETNDPTSILSFKKTVIEQQIVRHSRVTVTEVAHRSLAKRAGMSIWRFFWTKFKYVLNIKTDIKVKRRIREQQKQQKLEAEQKKNNDQNDNDGIVINL